MTPRRIAACFPLVLAFGCSEGASNIPPQALDGAVSDARADVTGDRADARADAPAAPVLVGAVPDHGSFLGGTEVTLRGSNFTEDMEVRFGGNLVQPRNTRYVDRNRIVVRTPAGRAGQVDIELRSPSSMRNTVLPRGYRYDSFYVDPGLGPTTGNARVSLHGLGTGFVDGMTVLFDGMPCTMVRVTSRELASCLTPAHPDGRVAVTVRYGAETLTVSDAYTYANSADQVGGGLSGGTLAGSLTVTVLDAMSGGPVPEAFVFLNNDPAATPPNAGRTNMSGQVTLSPPDVRPPVTVTASKRCFTTTTIQSFDARNATIYLTPVMLPGCGEGMPMGMAQRPSYPGRVRGELIWAGPNEFAPNPWSNVPQPRAGERRVAYVYATRPDIFTPDYPAMQRANFEERILEVVPEGYGGRGYPFDFNVRPGAIAIYALAGIERTSTGATTPAVFVPYMMGVARNVLASPVAPGTTMGIVDDLVVNMNVPLDHVTPLEVEAYPLAGTETTPNVFHASAFIDLGGEGVIPRPDLSVTGRRAGSYALAGLPAFTGALEDARLKIHARYASGNITGPATFQDTPAPCTGLILSGITTPDETVRVRQWMAIPDLMAPMQGAQLPADRTVRFQVNSTLAQPDLLILNLQWASGQWQHLAPGRERTIRYPDLSSLMGLADLPTGSLLQLSLVGVRIPGFDFNRFTYTTIGQAYWSAYAGRGTYVTR